MDNLLRKLDLTSLRLFVAVCQERNIARAAEREFIAPSAVSRRIADIEALIGLPVIQRQSRGIVVTPVGETLLRHALTVIGTIESLGAELSQYCSGAKGNVRIVANLASIVQFLPEDIAAFQRLFPDVNIDIEEHNSVEVLRVLEERGADFGICNAIEGLEHFERLHYRTDRLSLMIPHGHALAGATQIHFASLMQENFVGLRSPSALTILLAREAKKLGADLNIKIRVSSLDALCRMVHAGLGVAIVPHQVGELYLNTLNVQLIPLADVWATRELVVVFKELGQLSATAHTLVNFLAQNG
ncbi:LysR family transcriptional regulator [Noviherbaspirillum saxi]|uniref:LysR family transcriptional regulator n=1 Tax=Noviherbaspirillum saxi TaxID=2320863 RepID=A0A3A3FFF9_9BURK|nr:LysR family transcriptional regulator [Noviherbaspirillum saxi]RJF92086.1 LysR family transcriptional regulator [Noviherbaspirillum saxi]